MSKKYRSAEELYVDFPEIKELAERLEESEVEANKHNEERSGKIQAAVQEPNPLDINQKRKDARSDPKKHPEYAVISRICKNKSWETTIYKPKPGRKEFEDRLSNVLLTREPAGFEVKIWNGGRLKFDPLLTRQFWINQEEKVEAPESGSTAVLSGAQVEEMLKPFKDQMEQLKSSEGASKDQMGYKLLELNFNQQIQAIKHDNEKKDLIRTYEGLLLEKDQQIEELEKDIADLEDDLDEYEGALGNAQKEIEKKRETPGIVGLGAAIGERILVGLAMSDSIQSGIEKHLGWKKDDQQKIWKQFMEERNSQSENPGTGNEAGFTPVTESSGDFSKLSPLHKQLAESAQKIHVGVDEEGMKQIYTFYQFVCNEDGTINADRMKKILSMMVLIDKDEKEQKVA